MNVQMKNGVELVREVGNKEVKKGDWIIMNGTRVEECCSVSDRKMRQNYDVDVKSGEYEWNEYECLSGVRLGVIVDERVKELLLNRGDGSIMKQDVLLSVMDECEKVEMRKKKSVRARRVLEDMEIVTYTEKSENERVLEIGAPWNENEGMIVEMSDVLIVGEGECYRIGRSEWNQTYELVK